MGHTERKSSTMQEPSSIHLTETFKLIIQIYIAMERRISTESMLHLECPKKWDE
jgi:hypothetical protein